MNPIVQSALRIEAKVLPGHKIEIELPPDARSNAIGETIDIILLLPNRSVSSQNESIQDILSEIHAQRPENRSVEEIDRDFQLEREAWSS